MAADVLKYASGNSASTTYSSGVNNTDTAHPLTSDTNFAAKSGEGMVMMDEGTATEELAYATGKSGSSLTIPLANRGLEGGSAQAHASGATVKGILTAGMWNSMVDALAEMVSKTTGKFSQLKDANGNEILKHSATASAVNEITITNAATGNAPIISATGDDTNIDLKLLSKGTGALSVTGTTDYENNVSDDDDIPNKKWVSDNATGSTDGWLAAGETWTYASASTFTIAGVDKTAKYTAGTRLKFTQTTAKYAVVLSSSFSTDTTVTILVNTDYTIANAAITSPYYSYQTNPQGYPTWFNFSTTITNQGGAWTNAPTTGHARMAIAGKVVTVAVKWTYHATSGGSGSVRISLPVTPAVDGGGFGAETSNILGLTVHVDSANTRLVVQKYDGSSPIGNSLVDLASAVFAI